MIYVGIDIAKLNHFASAISSDGEELIKPFKFTNDNDGFQLLLSKLDPLDKDSLIIGLESTAHYGDNLVRYLVAKNYKVCVLNPIKTSTMRKNNIRKTKTDKVDTWAIGIIRVSRLYHHNEIFLIPSHHPRAALKICFFAIFILYCSEMV